MQNLSSIKNQNLANLTVPGLGHSPIGSAGTLVYTQNQLQNPLQVGHSQSQS